MSVVRRRQTGRAAIVAASLLAHGLALALLGLTTPGLREVRRVDPVVLEIWAASPALPSSRRSRPAVPAPSPLAPRQGTDSAPQSLIPALPLSPTARTALSDLPADPYPAQPPGQASADGVRQALRGSPVGCGNRDAFGLTRREREACDDAFGKRSVQTADIAAPIDPAKRGAWDAVAARKEIARRRKGDPPPMGVDTSNNAGGTRTNGIGILGY